jgi:hypothetical protein
MLLIRILRAQQVSEDLSELHDLKKEGWNLRDSSTRQELITIATKEVSICEFFLPSNKKPAPLAAHSSPRLFASC